MVNQLYLIFKEKDPRPYEAVAAELAHLTSPSTAEVLGKLLKKDDKRIRRAAAAALAARPDPAAQAFLPQLANDPDPEIRSLLLLGGTHIPQAEEQMMTVPVAQGRGLFRQMATGPGRATARAWLLTKFLELDNLEQIEVLGEWLLGSPSADATKTAAGP
jgi:hypothetical protein